MIVLCVRSALTPERNNVYHIFTLAGENWKDGNAVYGQVAVDRDVFRYSPVAAVTFMPWSAIPLPLGNVLWRLLNAAVFLIAVHWWLSALLPNSLNRKQYAAVFLLLLPMSIPSLNNGQINPLLIGLMLISVAAVKDGRFALAGVCVTAAFWIKLYPLAVGMLLLLLYRKQLSTILVLGLLAGFLAPFAFQEPGYVSSQYLSWMHYLRADNRELVELSSWPRDVRLLFKVWLSPLPRGVYPAIQLTTAAGIALMCWFFQRKRAPMQETLFLLTGLCCCWMTVFGPATESATWIIIAPPLVAALCLAWTSGSAAWMRGALLLSYLLFVGTHMAKWFPWGGQVSNLGPQALAGLIFFGCLIVTPFKSAIERKHPLIAGEKMLEYWLR